MKISDVLSRLVRAKSGDYEPDLSDEILNEVVIASVVSDTNLELLQLHQKNGHCNSDRLSRLSGASREKCAHVVKQCGDCVLRSKVREQTQIYGTIPDNKKKNDTWFIDFFYYKGVDNKFLSILDRSTRFFMATKVSSRNHGEVVKVLETEFCRLGTPKSIVMDREFISETLQVFAQKNNFQFCPITRESPWLNMVERYHQEIKNIARKSDLSIQKSINILNNLPFSRTPSGSVFKCISPAELFFKNDTKLLKSVCNFLEQESTKRITRQKELRGINITRFERKFTVGDIVRFHMGKHNTGFGKVINKINSKMYEVERIDGVGTTFIHSQQLEKVTISEEFLRQLLDT